MAVSRRLRFEILRRDNHTCRYCGRSAPEVPLTVDHVQPVALGGSDRAENLVTACKDCNSGKTSVPADAPTVANVAEDALRWARAIEDVAAGRLEERHMVDEAIAAVDKTWRSWHDTDGLEVPRPINWPDSLERFYLAGLEVDILNHLVGVALRKPQVVLTERWTFFCGCCWREIDIIQGQARDIIAFADQWKHEVQ